MFCIPWGQRAVCKETQVSLWGGGVALHNLVLKPDVLQQEVALPFTLISGRIHELLIQVPWTKIMSEPIVVTIDTIECVLNLKPPESPDGSPPPPPSRKTQVVEAPPGYMQALVRRIVNNIALKVHHLIVKYVQDDIVLSLNVKHLSIDSAGVNWEPSFADIDQYQPTVRRLVKLDDLTLCLDKADSDGKIRYYQEPLLYRCHLDLRVLTQLVSANCRRASSLNVTLRSSKLAFSVTSDQLTLLLRLMKERVPSELAQQATAAKTNLTSQAEIPLTTKTNSAESSRSTNSWSEWAWSWLPTWMDKEGGFEDIPVSPTPLPIYFDAFLDDLSLVFKVMEVVEGLSRKRSRSVMEVGASHAVVKSSICYPTSMTLRFGARDLLLRSHGKCVCGASNYDASINQATMYIKRIDIDETEGPWTWPKEVLSEPSITSTKVEEAQAVDEEYRPTPEGVPTSTAEVTDQPPPSNHKEMTKETAEDYDVFSKMRPLIYVEFLHERTPPSPFMNPYDNPPKDFQYSDWVEQCRVKVKLEPIELRLCMGLLHRFLAIRSIFKEVETEEIESATRVLTVEECEALVDNLPERRITFEARGLRFRLYPWNHYFTSKPIKSPIVLGIELPNVSVTTTAPLYPHRVCSAACQIPEDVGPLWQGARVHINAVIKEAQMLLTTVDNTLQKPCARADIHLVVHVLLKKSYFKKKESVHMSFLMKIRELNISGSWARLQAAYCAVESLISDKVSLVLKYSSLAKDALHDEEAVVLDFTLEEFIARGYITKNIRTFIVSVHSARATAFHEPVPGEVKQAWLFSAPDAPSTTPYLRIAFQWCDVPGPTYFDYLGFWAEATAVSIDPLLIAWLAYEPVMKPVDLASTSSTNVSKGSVQYFAKRKFSANQAPLIGQIKHRSLVKSPLIGQIKHRSLVKSSTAHWSNQAPLIGQIKCIVKTHTCIIVLVQWPGGAGGRGNKGGSSAELVHVRPRASADSSSEPSDRKRSRFAMPSKCWYHGEKLLAIHQRLKTILIHVEMGLIQVYITTSTVSAVDCVTLRDAMERHAIGAQRVLAISLGRIAMHSNSANKYLWQQLRHDGPTFIKQKPEAESFPWKISIADVSCYTLEAARIERDHSGSALRSTLKAQAGFVHPRTVLELVTTTITVSVVTKMLQIKNIELIPEHKRDTSATTQTERALESKSESIAQPQSEAREKVTLKEGPVVSLGVHLHADTPPIIIKLEKDQKMFRDLRLSNWMNWEWRSCCLVPADMDK
ncbi:unnamed protein product [Arctia plantaginis]|uniref:Vacuolar protein sorting-associated protein 13B n=1 Tax=Arctia plantaginis TaxID=874455 RepID=A0A8S1BHQ3_ARCPL|nr:unnamed protein product [Arctia plantaginis]